MTALPRSRPCLSSSPPAALTQSPAPPPGRPVCGSQVTRRIKYFSNMRKYFYFCKNIFVADLLVSMIAFVGLDCQVTRLCLTQTCCWQSRFSDPFSDDFLQNFPHCKSDQNAKIIFSISPASLRVRSRGASTDHSITASCKQTLHLPPSSKNEIPVISSQLVIADSTSAESFISIRTPN